MKSINPTTQEVLKEFENFSYDYCLKELRNSKRVFNKWKKTSFDTRKRYLKRLESVLLKNKNEYAKIMTLEMGKPITESVKEIEKCAWVCRYFADNLENMLKDEVIKTEMKNSYVTFEPLGVILGIMPWNFPFWQVFRFAIPTIAAGNVCVLKHASNVPWSSSTIELVFRKVGLQGVFKNLLIDSKIALKLIRSNELNGVSLTGSVEAGREIGELSGKNLKKVVLELGGSDPFIVLKDADLKSCCVTAVKARMVNSGQSCIAAKRFIVVKGIAKEFEELFLETVKSLKIGNPLSEVTSIGPLAKPELVDALERQVKDAVSKGAKVLYGGCRLNTRGNFFMPTVITNVKEEMEIFKEETFGPVAPIIIVKDEEEAIKIANNTNFGLGASIWTKNLKKGEILAKEIEAGVVFINGLVRSDPRLPFGGVKDSGIGRELSHYGLKEFVNIKTVVIER